MAHLLLFLVLQDEASFLQMWWEILSDGGVESGRNELTGVDVGVDGGRSGDDETAGGGDDSWLLVTAMSGSGVVVAGTQCPSDGG